ncbi:DNA polymerase I [Arsenicitalea aurantiaca]|uniref:DNA polymerase I n=1 Tax=Arsenicitalea aurantiaca TaxID=1783274 RepID=A0A433X866_9HYPH|nr:DNA polymerase I [Arsenicitalea aurantiaca]RUT30266.1 DNA polymerase I [Arsenicitalea aurantiaca]
MHLLLVDGSTYIFRAYHALPPLTRKSDGLPVGCVSGFCNMLFKLTEDLKGEDEPTHMAVIFDHSAKSFRNELYGEYKAHRPPAPEDLAPQFPLTRDATRAFSIPPIELEGWEADDIIATYACAARRAGGKVTIVSSDKDLMQLIEPDGSIRMLDTIPRPGQPPLRWIGPEEVFAKFGVTPDKVIEVQALCGDSVDNVPGVPGIGVKTAAELINTYGDLETLLSRAEEIKQPARRQKLIDNADLARISKQLVTLSQDVPLPLELDALARQPIDPGTLIPFLKAMEFTTITKRLAALLDADPDAWEADPALAAKPVSAVGFDNAARAEARAARHAADGKADAPAVLHAHRTHEAIRAIPFDLDAYTTITDPETLAAWIAGARQQGHVAIDTETTGLDNQAADLVGISLALAPGQAAYIPLGHVSGEGDIFGGGHAEGQMEMKDAIALLAPLLADPSILKIFHNFKYDHGVLCRFGLPVEGFDDTILLSYALDGPQFNTMAELARHWLGHEGIPIKDLLGSGKSQKTFAQVPIPDAARYGAEDADITLRLWHILKARLVPENATAVYETLERKLAPVLARMEARGISVDRQILARLSGDFAQRAAAFEAEAHELAGEKFNLGSPKQLGDILFGKLGLPGGTRTKSGQWATGAGVLEDLAARENVPLAKVIVDWRGLTKLKGTYTDALPGYINPRTGRVHTTYSQHSVLTGRLSSNDPNLQNIPIRTEDGRKIRTAFVAAPGNELVSADYSQIELRILAHIADIQALKDAFEEGLDIHAMTASEMFKVPIEGMPSEIRRRAKAINFGIIYGISAFGLANQLGIPRGEAGDYIKTYFERFPGIRDYMEEMRRRVKSEGFVTTLFGRKILFPNANSKNPAERAFVERASINAPIQGTAADLIRRAMIRMEPGLKAAKIEADMLLQVHDELIFEIPEGTADKAIPVITDIMQTAAEPAIRFSIPIQVDAHAATNWDEAH